MKAYKHKGMKLGSQGESKPAKSGDQSMAPSTSPSMQHKEPSAQYQYPKNGEQSMAPDHNKKSLPMQDAPAGVSSCNGGSSMSLPKGGGVGESEV